MAGKLGQAAVSNWHCRNRDEVAAALESVFPDTGGLALVGRGRGFYHDQTLVSVGDVRLARYHNSGIRFTATQSDSLHIGVAIRGSARVKSQGVEVSTRPFLRGNAIAPCERFLVDVSPGTISYTVELPRKVIESQAEALFGRSVDPVDCEAEVDLNNAAGSALVRNLLSSFNEIVWLESTKLSPLGAADFSEILTNLVLATVFPAVCEELGSEVADAGQTACRRARQYLDACAHQPLRISDLAREMNVSVRGLQVGFRRQFGCSPLQYLLARRLELARERLMAPLPGDTVTTVATEFGFMNLGKFAARYRARFCELPSETLKRSKARLGA